MNSKLKTYSSALLLLLLAFFSFLMLRITLQYIPINLDVAFLRIKQDYINIIPWRIAFFTHVFTSMFALLAGFTQFSKYILKNHKKTQRWLYIKNWFFIFRYFMDLFYSKSISFGFEKRF